MLICIIFEHFLKGEKNSLGMPVLTDLIEAIYAAPIAPGWSRDISESYVPQQRSALARNILASILGIHRVYRRLTPFRYSRILLALIHARQILLIGPR